jgi:DNA polymerase elongation subunit (family B)
MMPSPPPVPPTAAENGNGGNSNSSSYPIPENARNHGVIRIYDRKGSDTEVAIEYEDTTLSVDFSDKKWADMFEDDAEGVGKDEEVIKATLIPLHSIENKKREAYNLVVKERSEKSYEEELIKKEILPKYSQLIFSKGSSSVKVLYESAIVNWQPSFVSYHNDAIEVKREIKLEWEKKKLAPYADKSHTPYSFNDDEELQQYIEEVLSPETTLASLWKEVHSWVKKSYDTDDEHIINLIATMIVYSYFADKFGLQPYIFLYGHPGSGKGAILKIHEILAYRVVGMSLVSAAVIYRILGDVETHQVTMSFDEAGTITEDTTLREVIKTGNKGRVKIPRNFDPTSSENATLKYFFTNCCKIFAAQQKPKDTDQGGFFSRTLFIETFFGEPEIFIERVADYADEPENEKILSELTRLRKRLFAYRLAHFNDRFPKLKLNLSGREEDLCIGPLQLFQDTEVFDTIKDTFFHFIKPNYDAKKSSFAVHVATVIRHMGKIKSENKEIADEQLLQQTHKAVDEEINEISKHEMVGEIYLPPLSTFDSVEIESRLIWEAIQRTLQASVVDETHDEDEEEDGGSSSSSKKQQKQRQQPRRRSSSNSNSGQKAMISDLYGKVTWRYISWALNNIGGKSGRGKAAGVRAWKIDGKKLARYERSYRLDVNEIRIVKSMDASDTSDTSQKTQPHSDDNSNEGETPQNNGKVRPPDSPSEPGSIPDIPKEPVNPDIENPSSVSHHVSEVSEASINSSQTELQNNDNSILTSGGGGGTQSALLLPPPPSPPPSPIPPLPKPRVFAGDGTQESLFFGQPWISWDLEWDPLTSKVYAAGFLNYKGERQVLHIQDPEFGNDEGKLLDKILELIMKYPVSFGYYSTGIELWNGKGKDSDLMVLHKRLQENGRVSLIEIFQPEYGYGRKRPRFKQYCNHTHIDLYGVFSNEVIKNFIAIEEKGKYEYRTDKLEYVAKVLTGQGKMPGMTGMKAIHQPVEIQREYILWDAISTGNIVASKFGRKVFDLLKEFADAIHVDLEWICHTTITAWWTKIFDDLGCTRPVGTEKEDYDGALVLPCKSGYYENVVLVDVKSLYPTMAIIHNLGFDTINCSCCEHDPAARVPRWALIDPESHPINKEYWVCRKHSSVYRDRLLFFRAAKEAAETAGLKMSKQMYKLLCNASYGSFATWGFGYLFAAVSELITGWGRFTLRVMNAVALAMGLQPIAGDTDSLFLANVKSKEQLDEFFRRCQQLLRVQDPLYEKGYWDVEIENELSNKDAAPVTFKCFWNVMKKHYYAINTNGKFDSTKMEVEKDDRVEYSAEVLWKYWQQDLENGKDPLVNLKHLTETDYLRSILELYPDMLKYSQKLGEDPGYIDEKTGEVKECTYDKETDPKIPVAREQGLRKGDICYFFKTGENKRILKVDDKGNPLGTYTTNSKYASITKIKQDLAEAWMNPLKVYLGYRVVINKKDKTKEDKEVESKLRKEIFGLDR